MKIILALAVCGLLLFAVGMASAHDCGSSCEAQGGRTKFETGTHGADCSITCPVGSEARCYDGRSGINGENATCLCL